MLLSALVCAPILLTAAHESEFPPPSIAAPAESAWSLSGLAGPTQQEPPPGAQLERASRGRFQVLLGGRSLDETYWEPLDNPGAFEVSFQWRNASTPLSFEFGTSLSYDDTTQMGVDISSTSIEFYAGLRATAMLADGHLRPYIGIGPSLVNTDITGESGGFTVTDDDTAFGFYLRGGLEYVFGNGFGLGVDFRTLLGTDVSLFDVDGDVDFDQLALSFGFAL